MQLVSMDIPRPKLDSLKSFCIRGGKTITRNFHESAYENRWLCGSETLTKLFCWPCLLFRSPTDKGIWSKIGYSDLNHLSSAIKAHAASREHIDNAMSYKTFGKNRIDEALDHGREVKRNNHNVTVAKNRAGMKTLIEVVCFLGARSLSFRSHDETDLSVNHGNYKYLCAFVASRDPAFSEFINTNNVFSGTSATIQNDLIRTVGELMLEEIGAEIKQAEYVAVMVDETTDTSRKSQLATSLRYCLKNGKFNEQHSK